MITVTHVKVSVKYVLCAMLEVVVCEVSCHTRDGAVVIVGLVCVYPRGECVCG